MNTQNTADSLNPVTHKLTDTTLDDIKAIGARMALDGDHFERLIWQVRAEAFAQFGDAIAKYQADEAQTLGSGSVEAVVEAGNRIAELQKLYGSAVALRNRAVHFAEGQMDRWPALAAVYEARVERK